MVSELKSKDYMYPSFGLVVLLEKECVIEQQSFEKELKEMNASAAVEAVGNNAFSVAWGAAKFVIQVENSPISEEMKNDVIKQSHGMENVDSILQCHRSQVRLKPFAQVNETGLSVALAIDMMKLALAMSVYLQPVGYCWQTSNVLHGVEGFKAAVVATNKAMREKSSGNSEAAKYLPTPFWVGIQLTQDDSGCWGVLSKGLESFSGYEIEIMPLNWKPNVVARRLYGVVSYIFDKGNVLLDGETLGVSQREKFAIINKDSVDGDGKVLALSLLG